METFKLTIYWPMACLPEHIDRIMTNDELFRALLESGHIRARMYKIDVKNLGNEYRNLIIDPSKPHIRILKIEKDEFGYEATCSIPDVPLYRETFAAFEQPVLFATVLVNTKTGDVKFLHFAVTEYEPLSKRGNAYGGINYPYPDALPIILKEDS